MLEKFNFGYISQGLVEQHRIPAPFALRLGQGFEIKV